MLPLNQVFAAFFVVLGVKKMFFILIFVTSVDLEGFFVRSVNLDKTDRRK